jgi:hypothetical protein
MIRDEKWSLSTDAVMIGPQPRLETCGDADQIDAAQFALQSVSVTARMACRGIVIVSDAWFPGWVATVDGRTAPIQRVDLDLRGIVVEKGTHSIVMRYRPLSFIAGFLLLLIGIGATLFAVKRDRGTGPDLLATIELPPVPAELVAELPERGPAPHSA